MITDTIIQNKVASVIKLSIITPVFNAAGFINNFIKTLKEQKFQEWEIIFLENCSIDNTADLIRSFSSNDSRIILITEKDKGIYDAMNKGIGLAKGEWLYFMGSDDFFYDEMVLSKISKYLNPSSDIVYGDSLWVPEMIEEVGEWSHTNILYQSINHQRIFYKRNLFSNEIKYNINYKVAADHALNIRLFCDKNIVKNYFPILIAKYYSGGYSRNKIDESFWDDWDLTFYNHFKGILPKKIIFSSLGIYCRYLIDKKKYNKFFRILIKIFLNTFSIGVSLLILKYMVKNMFTYEKS